MEEGRLPTVRRILKLGSVGLGSLEMVGSLPKSPSKVSHGSLLLPGGGLFGVTRAGLRLDPTLDLVAVP